MRHPAAAFMVDGGADPLQVMRRMGHSDIRTTYNLYGHLFPDREDELLRSWKVVTPEHWGRPESARDVRTRKTPLSFL